MPYSEVFAMAASSSIFEGYSIYAVRGAYTQGGDFVTFYPDVWAGVSETHPLWCNGRNNKIDP